MKSGVHGRGLSRFAAVKEDDSLIPNLMSKMSNSKKWGNGAFEIFETTMEDQDIRFWEFKKGIMKGANDERISYLAAKFKLNNIWTPFRLKNVLSWSKTWKNIFRTLFGQKGGQLLFYLNFEARFEIFSSFATYMIIFLKIHKFFWVPMVIKKKIK